MKFYEPKIKKTVLGPAKCAVDIGDGSERGFYVKQDYILSKMGRPHRAVNLMYCYYPFDKEWPNRVSDVVKPDPSMLSWPYPYDDYFPFVGDEPLKCIEDVRRAGQDAILTLTCDCAVTDDMIIEIANKLRPYGRLMLRLNHECTGSWFSFNRRYSYQQVADFFVRFKGIFAKHAPNVRVILCAGCVTGEGKLEKEEEFTKAYQVADIWSLDHYPSLNWGWPREVADDDNNSHKCNPPESVFENAMASQKRMVEVNGGEKKPFQICEYNEDGDVTGAYRQAERVRYFYDMIEEKGGDWFNGITMYQFRDDGRLGLEITDPSNRECGIEQPLMKVYRDIIHRDHFMPLQKETEAASLPCTLRWGGSEDAEGIAMEIEFEKNPAFCELYYPESLVPMDLVLEINGRWFRKAPGVNFTDLMSAFFEKPLTEAKTLPLRIFALPADGKNPVTEAADWDVNYVTTIHELPNLRLRYTPVMDR